MVGDSLCYSYYISCEDVSYSVPFLFLHIFPRFIKYIKYHPIYGYINYQTIDYPVSLQYHKHPLLHAHTHRRQNT